MPWLAGCGAHDGPYRGGGNFFHRKGFAAVDVLGLALAQRLDQLVEAALVAPAGRVARHARFLCLFLCARKRALSVDLKEADGGCLTVLARIAEWHRVDLFAGNSFRHKCVNEADGAEELPLNIIKKGTLA